MKGDRALKFIIENKVYDTENADEILKFSKSYPTKELGDTIHQDREVVLYKTKKGNWFTVVQMPDGKYECRTESKSNIKRILKGLNEVEIYTYHFEGLEEA